MLCSELRSIRDKGIKELTPEFAAAAEKHAESCEPCRTWLAEEFERLHKNMVKAQNTLSEIRRLASV